MYHETPNTLHEIINTRYEGEIHSTSVEKPLQITPFYAKQTQFIERPILMQTQYIQMVKKICCSIRAKKTNPIQTQFKPKQTQFNPIQTQNRPNSKPIAERVKMNAFAPILPLYKTNCHQYYTRSYRRCSSMEEHSFRKAEVEGSTPSIGFVSLEMQFVLNPRSKLCTTE